MHPDDDDVPWADPQIRVAYEASLGRFILAFNEVDCRLTQLIGWELSMRRREVLTASWSRGSFAQRSTAEFLATGADPEIASPPFQQLRTLGGHRNILARGRFDQKPFRWLLGRAPLLSLLVTLSRRHGSTCEFRLLYRMAIAAFTHEEQIADNSYCQNSNQGEQKQSRGYASHYRFPSANSE